MKLEEQVLTIEQAKHLQELGMDMSDAAFVWNTNLYTKDTHLGTGYIDRKRSVYTYTLQEVLDKLPIELNELKIGNQPYLNVDFGDMGIISYEELNCDYSTCTVIYFSICEYGILDAAYQLLCWVLENGYLKEDKK